MAIVRNVSVFQSLLLASAIALVGCGGSGGGGSKSSSSNSTTISSSSVSSTADSSSVASSSSIAPPDTTPNAFTFSGVTNAEPSIGVVSSGVVIKGIDAAATISIVGGEYSIDGSEFTSAAGTISNGQTLSLRILASDKTNTPVDSTVTVGGVSATFTVTTLVDVTPDAFEFTAKTEAEFETDYTSNTIMVNGIDVAVPISITGGEYSVDSGAYASTASTISAGQTVVVKTKSGASTEITSDAVLTIGGVTGAFTVTTPLDTAAPVAEFKFPTPYTMSEANEVKVRGVATDDHAIIEVKLVVRSFDIDTPESTLSTAEVIATPKSEIDGVKDFSSWTATIPLTADAENEIKVVALDDRDNESVIEQANKVVIRQADVSSAFPDEVNQFDILQDIALGGDSDLKRLFAADDGKILEVDAASGKRSVFLDHESYCNDELLGLTFDYEVSNIYGICKDEIYIFDLINRELVSKHPIPYESERYYFTLSVDKFGGRNRLVIYHGSWDGLKGIVIGFSLDTKEFSIISGSMEEPEIVDSIGDIAVFEDFILVPSGGQHADADLHNVIRIDSVTGKRTIFADNSIGSGELFSALLPDGNTAALTAIASDIKKNRLFLYEIISSKLFSINFQTGERSLLRDMSYVETINERASFFDADFYEKDMLLIMPDTRREALIVVDVETGEKAIISKNKNNY